MLRLFSPSSDCHIEELGTEHIGSAARPVLTRQYTVSEGRRASQV